MPIEKAEDLRGSTKHSFHDVWELCDSYAAALYKLEVMKDFIRKVQRHPGSVKVSNPDVLQAFDRCEAVLLED